MRIQHNIAALSAYRNLTANNSAVSKNLEKLSSGYKINRAGDDAAGLAISEKMRAQITGLETAQKNANDGISLIQTAEGALTEVHSMLNRMVELANQSANGTYQDDDRVSLQSEVTALLEEIDRISESTNFNGRTLLNGDLGITKTSADAVATGLENVAAASITNIADGAQAKEPVRGKFTLDLSQFKVGVKSDAPSVNGTSVTGIAAGSVKVEFGVTSGASAGTAAQIQITNTKGIAKGEELTGKDLAEQFLKDTSMVSQDGDTNYVTIDNQKFSVTHDGEGRLTFEMMEDPTEEFTTQLDVKTTVSFNGKDYSTLNDTQGTGATGGNLDDVPKADISFNQGAATGVIMDREAVYAGERIYAEATVDLTAIGKTLEDGTAIKIGNETYIFALGSESQFKGKDHMNIVDLTDLPEGASQADIAKAAALRLSQVAKDNDMFIVGTDNNKSGMIYLKEKEGVDYSKNDLEGTASTDNRKQTDATNWAGLIQVGKGNADAKAASTSGGLTLQIGDTSDAFNQMTVGIDSMAADALGIKNIDISTQAGAQTAVDKIKAAINTVSAQRGSLGALQNRLEHTINNLSVTTENITAAESRIRDVDMAEEMMAYTKNNILVQASQAMLAQANQIPQGVLQLLQ